MKAVERTSAKFSTWAIDCRMFEILEDSEDNMVGGLWFAIGTKKDRVGGSWIMMG